jgi:hypothetical protein
LPWVVADPRRLSARRRRNEISSGDFLAGDGGDELVLAHADVPVQAPDREHDVVLPEGAVPRERVV